MNPVSHEAVSCLISHAIALNGGVGFGGGLLNAKTATITNCTFSSNIATGGKGGFGGRADASEFGAGGNGGNGGDGRGGAMQNGSNGTAVFTNCTFSGGSAIGGILGNAGSGDPPGELGAPGSGRGGNVGRGGTITLRNTIVANSRAGGNCSGSGGDGGHNLSSDNSCGFGATGFNSTNPLLESLANNGGLTKTHGLQENSPAIDAADDEVCPETDQRGVPRPQGPACDIGAFERRLVPMLRLTIAPATFSETAGANAATGTVQRNTSTTEALTVKLRSSDTTEATVPASVTIPVGADKATFQITAVDDNVTDGSQTVRIVASTAGFISGDKSVRVTDNERAVLRISDVRINEPNRGTNAVAYFVVTLSVASTRTVTVRFSTTSVEGTARTRVDYVTTSGTLTFAPGVRTRRIPVTIIGDNIDEVNETFFVNLSDPINATIADGHAMGTIVDNDLPPSLQISDKQVVEPNSGSNVVASFTVKLSAPSGKTVTVKFATADGTAKAPGDYTARSLTTLSFAPGVTSRTIPVTVKGDNLNETNESFFVNLSTPVSATISDSRGSGVILDNNG